MRWQGEIPEGWELGKGGHQGGIVKGNRLIRQIDDHFVIVEDETWIPGAYSSVEAAIRAFEFPNSRLREIQNGKPRGGMIDISDLQL